MSDQTAPPEQLAPAPAPQGKTPAEIDTIDPKLEEALANAIEKCAAVAAAAGTPQEMSQAADAALKLAQTMVILDPQLVAPQGIPAIAMYPPKPEIPFDKKAPGSPKL